MDPEGDDIFTEIKQRLHEAEGETDGHEEPSPINSHLPQQRQDDSFEQEIM